MAVVYFSLGANIGDKRNNMITAVRFYQKGWGVYSPFLIYMKLPPGGLFPKIIF